MMSNIPYRPFTLPLIMGALALPLVAGCAADDTENGRTIANHASENPGQDDSSDFDPSQDQPEVTGASEEDHAMIDDADLAASPDQEIVGAIDQDLLDAPHVGGVGELEVEVEPLPEVTAARPKFQLPFPCGQRWVGSTRSYHSPKFAVDFNRSNDYGDRVEAAASGRVSIVGNAGNRSYGRWIEINHGGGYRTRYAHLSKQSVRVGQKVSRGQKIGNVGNTGGSSGAHLHYELRKNGVAVRAIFNNAKAYYFGKRTYTSRNCD